MKGITPQERLEKWNAAICAQKASGLTIKEWCEQNGLIRTPIIISGNPRCHAGIFRSQTGGNGIPCG